MAHLGHGNHDGGREWKISTGLVRVQNIKLIILTLDKWDYDGMTLKFKEGMAIFFLNTLI